MRRATMIPVMAGLLLLCDTTTWAASSLAEVTPQNLEQHRFTLMSKAMPKGDVEFVIRRDVRGISLPGKRAFVSDAKTEPNSMGTPIKVEEDGHFLTYRFSVRKERIANSTFTLCTPGGAAVGATYRFRLSSFRQPKKE